MGANAGAPTAVCAARSCVQGMSTIRPSVAGVSPSCAMNARATCAAASRGMCAISDPLCTAARWNRPRAAGMLSNVLTFQPPPDWPKIVTQSGSPPKSSMWSRTHSRGSDEIQHAGDAGFRPATRRVQISQVQVSEAREAVSHCDHHYVAQAG